jgi:hypothetical protein
LKPTLGLKYITQDKEKIIANLNQNFNLKEDKPET